MERSDESAPFLIPPALPVVADAGPIEPGKGETLDALFGGRLKLIQPADGYRFSVDAPLLANFALPAKGRVIDLGAGCGVVALALFKLGRPASVTGLEIQARLAEIAKRNVKLNGAGGKVNIVKGDIRRVRGAFRPESFDVAVSNPPFRSLDEGRPTENEEKLTAKHEAACGLSDLVTAAVYLLRSGGSLKLVFAAGRLQELMTQLSLHKLAVKKLRAVHPRAGGEAKLALVEAVKGGGRKMRLMPPLIIYSEGGEYTEEMKKILYPRIL